MLTVMNTFAPNLLTVMNTFAPNVLILMNTFALGLTVVLGAKYKQIKRGTQICGPQFCVPMHFLGLNAKFL